MVEPVEHAARRSLRLPPPGAGDRDPRWRFGGGAADVAPCRFGQERLEDKAPAVSFRIRDISGGADEIAKLKIADGETPDGKLADRYLPHRPLAIIGES